MKKIRYLVLVRHGESQWNAQGLWTGWTDIPLSEKGRHEAKIAASVLADIPFDVGITTDLSRASETLDIIKNELGLLSLKVIKDAAFKERHYGEFTGKSKWEIKKILGEEKFQQLRRGWDEPIKEGETLKNVFHRVMKGFEKHILPAIAQGKNILLVAHGNSNRALMKHIEGISDEMITQVELATGEVIVYQLDNVGKLLKKEKRAVNRNIGKQ